MIKDKESDEIHQIKRTLDRQDKVLDEISKVLKGSAALDTEGVLPALKRISRDLEAMIDWKNSVELKRGTINVRDVMKILAWIVGIAGGVFGIFSAYYQVFKT